MKLCDRVAEVENDHFGIPAGRWPDRSRKFGGRPVAELIGREVVAGGKAGRDGLLALMAARGVRVTGYADWQAIDAAEVARARSGSPREKFVRVSEMLDVIGGS